MPVSKLRIPLAVVVAAALVASCGKSGDAATEDSAAAAQTDSAAASAPDAAPAPAAAAPAADATDAPLTVADIDRWQRGMEAEAKAVQDAADQLKAAKSGADSLSAVMAANASSTQAAGAQGAGVDLERYKHIRSTLSEIVSQMSPLEQEMDVSKMPPSMIEEMKKGREAGLARVTAGLSPEFLEALRPRAAALRKQELALVGDRLKAAGVAR